MIKFYQSVVLENRILTEKFRLIRLKLEKDLFNFQVGQFVMVKIREALYRSYSVASSLKQLPEWEMIVNISPQGPGTKYLTALKIGDRIETTKPLGFFTLKGDQTEIVILGATGCGIASIKPMLEVLLKQQRKEIYLLWGLRFEEDLFFVDLLEDWKKQYPNFHYEIVLSQPKDEWIGKKGYITQYLEEFLKEKRFETTSIYLCGNGEMIKDMTKVCEKLHFPKNRVYFEKYF